MSVRFDGWPHIICAQQFSRDWLEREFLPLTDEMQTVFNRGGCRILKRKTLVSFFYQPSSRTRMSFEMAMDYLGGRVVFSTENAREFSSAKKGETLKDTFRVVNRYRPDAIVIRYDREIGAKFAAEVSRVPIINAGDREPGQHPTQALLDLRTIFKRRGSIDGLKIAMVGDLDKGRTVRSLSYLLGKFSGVEIDFISPLDSKMGDDVKEYLHRHGVIFRESTDLREVTPHVDVIYQTRTQLECGSYLDRSDFSQGYFIVDQTITGLMKKDAIIMHPLPRVDEITTDVDDDPRAVYLTEQIDSGLFTRMALLKMILAPIPWWRRINISNLGSYPVVE
jgi:aspartate carbamoyltransferase catalytic subunit